VADDLSERQRRAAEAILEDEGLTGDLTDEQARPLLDWASAEAARAAGSASRSDAELSADVARIRRAVREAARDVEAAPAQLVARAAALAAPPAPKALPAEALPRSEPGEDRCEGPDGEETE
jgi:hypothetical protein